MIRSLKQAWNDPVTRWEYRFLESQHRKPRRWWLALVALPGITAAVIAFGYLTPFTDMWVFGLITTLILLYLVGAVVTVSLSAAALAKRDPSVMGEHLMLTGVTARRLAFARVIALWRHHRRLWLLLVVLRLIFILTAAKYLFAYPRLLDFSITPATEPFYYLGRVGWGHDCSIVYACAPTPNLNSPSATSFVVALIVSVTLTASDGLILCAIAALFANLTRSEIGLTVLFSTGFRMVIAVTAFLSMVGISDLNARGSYAVYLLTTKGGAGTHLTQVRCDFYHVPCSQFILAKLPADARTADGIWNHIFELEGNYARYTRVVITDSLQLTASTLIDGGLIGANFLRPNASAHFLLRQGVCVGAGVLVALLIIRTHLVCLAWILRRRGVLA